MHQVTGYADWLIPYVFLWCILPSICAYLKPSFSFCITVPLCSKSCPIFSMMDFQALLVSSALCLLVPQTSWKPWCTVNFFMKSDITFQNHQSQKTGEELGIPLKSGHQCRRRMRNVVSILLGITLWLWVVRWWIWISTRCGLDWLFWYFIHLSGQAA